MSDLATTIKALLGNTDPMPFGMGSPAEPAVAAPGFVMDAINSAAALPKRTIDASKHWAATGEFDPAPYADAAMTLGAGGVPMAEKGAAGIFGGRLAKTADLKALHEAEQMQAGGKHAADIWRDTGWMQSPMDAKWRFEIPDNKMALKYMPTSGEKAFGSVDSLLSHPELKKAYPEVFHHDLEITRDLARPLGEGGFAPSEPLFGGVVNPRISIIAPHMPLGRSVAGHELQHDVQGIEGFAFGSAPRQFATILEDKMRKSGNGAYNFNELDNKARDLYHRTAGEVESRNVQKRLDYSPAERKLMPPWETQDVPYDQQLLIEALKNFK